MFTSDHYDAVAVHALCKRQLCSHDIVHVVKLETAFGLIDRTGLNIKWEYYRDTC